PGRILRPAADRPRPGFPVPDPHSLGVNMRSSRVAATAGAIATALALVLSACGSDSSTSGGTGTSGGNSIVDKAKNDKALNIGVKPDQPGLGLQDSSGQYSGFDIDVARYVAGKLGAT